MTLCARFIIKSYATQNENPVLRQAAQERATEKWYAIPEVYLPFAIWLAFEKATEEGTTSSEDSSTQAQY